MSGTSESKYSLYLRCWLPYRDYFAVDELDDCADDEKVNKQLHYGQVVRQVASKLEKALGTLRACDRRLSRTYSVSLIEHLRDNVRIGEE